eukprot:c16666_g1_i3.p1 GENE.c16666_g1_i3~~c16666_g1_i3.p1  ORF type:complete len:303 (+),score=82.11 c16666_g1_i3:90-911(+)
MIATIPYYIDIYLFFTTASRPLMAFRFLLSLRIIFPLLRMERYSKAFQTLNAVIRVSFWEITLTLLFAIALFLLSSTIIYYLECGDYPCEYEDFDTIPKCMWWSVSVLTTVGYGDVVPHTIQGKAFGGVISLIGVAVFSIPPGILASSFVQVMLERHERLRSESQIIKTNSFRNLFRKKTSRPLALVIQEEEEEGVEEGEKINTTTTNTILSNTVNMTTNTSNPTTPTQELINELIFLIKKQQQSIEILKKKVELLYLIKLNLKEKKKQEDKL